MENIKIKYLVITVLLTSTIIVFYSCGSDVSKDSSASTSESAALQSRFPADLPANQSIVKAMVESIYSKDKDDFFLKARILTVKSKDGMPSFAITGASYILVPSYQTDKNNQITSSAINQDIASLIHLKSGDTFVAVISYKQFTGWFIQDVKRE